MELGCPSLPYQSYLYFVNETGHTPAERMHFDKDNGVTVLAVLAADPGFAFSEPVQWAVITDFELKERGLTYSQLHNGLFQGERALSNFLTTHNLCYLKRGQFENTGELYLQL
jgi:hypothetical protein